MTSVIELSERISFNFQDAVPDLCIDLRLHCLPVQQTQVIIETITVIPGTSSQVDHTDPYGNKILSMTFDRPVTRLVVSAYHRLMHTTEKPMTGEPLPSDLISEDGDAYPLNALPEVQTLSEDVVRVIADLRTGWAVDPAITRLDRTLHEIDRSRRGVCQDMARLAVDRLRKSGIPARFLVGYALTDPIPKVLQRHAWIAVYMDGRWQEIDVANLDDRPATRVATAWGGSLAKIGPVNGRTHLTSVVHRSFLAQARRLQINPTQT